MNKLTKIAFTLIELLVVIAIIGILSGLIIVTMNGVTNKANIAKAQIFSNSLRNSLMLNLVAEYKLDGNGNDSWGTHNGTINGTTTSSSDCIYGTCLSFNGSTYISIPDDDAVFNFGTKMTVIAWVNGYVNNPMGVVAQYDIGNNKRSWMMIHDNGYNKKLRVVLSNDGTYTSGHLKDYYTTTASPFDSTWHQIGFSWNSGTLKLYVDGAEASTTKPYDDAITSLYNSDVNLTIGSYLNSTPYNYFTGSIDEIRIYNESVPTSQIKEQYYSVLNSLLLSGGITKEEYLSKLNNYAKN